MKRVLKWLGFIVVAFVVAGVAIFAFGGRVVMDGGGGLHLRFPESPASIEQTVESHRKSQAAAPVSQSAVAPVGAPAAPESAAAPAAPVLPASEDWSDFR